MAKRFFTYFGISFPPWRKKKIGAGALTIRFAVKGRVPSKKNHQQAVAVRKDAYQFIKDIFRQKGSISQEECMQAIKKVHAKMRSNQEYNDFLAAQKPYIEAQRNVWLKRLQDKGLTFPIPRAAMNVRFYFAQQYRQDSVNKQQSIQDLLKDCLIITDDDYTCLNPITCEADCFYGEISANLTFVSLTFKI
jgi:hypothetical protein